VKKTVPFKKEISFKTPVSEITSIALDHEFDLVDRMVKGNLIISGSYKINDVSVNTEQFNYNIPVNIEMSNRYILDNIKIDVDDFYYEIINNNVLSVNVEVGIDNLEEKEINPIKYEEEQIEKVSNIEESRMEVEDVKSLFDNFEEASETFATYKVCIVKESDTIESIMLKYNINKTMLEQYNDLSDLKIGDKLIIPTVYNETN